MFCPKCGKENKDGAKFCAGCGNPLPVLQNAPLTEPPGINPDSGKPSKKGKGKKKWIFIGAGAAALIIAAAVVMILFWGKGGTGKGTQEEYLEAAENYGEVNASLIEVAESIGDEDMTTDEKAQLYLDALEELEEEGLIQESSVVYDESISEISYNYADGAAGGILLEEIEEETSGYGTDSYITSYKDDGYAATVTSDPVSFDIEGYPYEEENLSAYVCWGLGEGYEDELEFMEGSVINWNKAYLTTQIDYDLTLAELRNDLAGYDLVVIQLHGYAGCGYPVLDEAVSWADAAFYASDEAIDLLLTEEEIATIEDLQSGRVEMKLTSLNGWSTFNYIICPDFFTYYYGDNGLEDTIVWLGCCDGYLYDDLVNSVYDCGADAVLACTESVITYYNIFCLDAFVYSLLYGNTVDESLSLAQSAYGTNDNIFAQSFLGETDDTPSEIRYCEGSADITLVTLTQEAIDALSGTRITDKTSLYQAYYDKLLEYEALWGTSDRSYDEDTSYVGLTGLCFAHLIDMDGDGEEELLLGYQDSYITDYEIELELWADVDGELTLVSSPDLASLDGGSFLFNMITELDGTYYIVNGDLGNGGGGTFYLYSYSDGKLSLSKTLVAGGEGECSIDGESVSVDEAWELADEIYNNAQYYYFYEFTYYSDPTDFTMADDELEVTLKILMDYLGIGTSSSASGSSDDWASIYLDFLEDEITVGDGIWSGYTEAYYYEYYSEGILDYIGFGLIYVNDDKIPELVMYGGSEADGMLIFTIGNDGEIDVIMSERTASFYYAEYGNLLVNSAGVTGWSWDYIYAIEDGSWVQLARGDYEYYDADEDGTLEYYWNDEEVTEEEYEENLSSYEAGLSMTYPESDPEYDLSELKEYLNAQ